MAADSGAKILIADDSDIFNHMLRDVFEEVGYEVVQAFDGIECKSQLLKHKPDIVILDVQMPKIGGLEVLKFIKEKDPRTIVVMITGVGNQEIAVRAMKAGAADYLTKPFITQDMITLVETLLRNRREGDENQRLRNEIRRSERYQAHLTSIINEALITTDPAGNVEFINRAATDMWGYTNDELKGHDVHLLIRSETRTALNKDIVRRTISDGRFEGEFLFRRKNKTTFPGYLSASVIKDFGRLRGIVMVVADLTRVYEVERRLKQSEKLASLGKVVEGIAHEVRNSLTSLGGFAQRLQKELVDNTRCLQFTRIILDDVARLERMVRDIEDYVGFSKHYAFTFEKTAIMPIIERARDRINRKLPPEVLKSVHFTIKSDKKPYEITIDAKAIEEVCYNLLLNGYEAMPNGGKLTVTLGNIGASTVITISDTGKGIQDRDVNEVYNPFFTSKTTGAGMGLSKVFLIVEEHGGRINVKSAKDKGTTFEIILPAERPLMGFGR